MNQFVPELIQALARSGFRPVANPDRTIPGATALFKRQNPLTNRAVVLIELPELPVDFARFAATTRKQVAFRCGFVPFFFGIGIQLIVTAPEVLQSELAPGDYVAKIDNQWAIIQSIFLVDTCQSKFLSARSRGQIITGQFQDAIENALLARYEKVQSESALQGEALQNIACE